MRAELALMLEDINTKFGKAQKQEFDDESIDHVNSLQFKYRLPNHFVAIAQLCALHFTNIVVLEMNHGISEAGERCSFMGDERHQSHVQNKENGRNPILHDRVAYTLYFQTSMWKKEGYP